MLKDIFRGINFQNKYVNLIKESLVFSSFFSYIYILGLPLLLFFTPFIREHDWAMTALIAFAGIFYLIFLIYYFRKDLIKEWKIFKDNFNDVIDVTIKYWFIGVIGMVVLNYLIATFLPSATPTNQNLIEEQIFKFPLYMAFAVIIFAPLAEELIFRKLLRRMFPTPWVFIFMSTLTFGVCHVVASATGWHDFALIVPYAVLGWAFAMTYIKTKTIYSVIFIHAIHNGMLFAVIVAGHFF